MDNKELNYTMLCGYVTKVNYKKETFILNYKGGKIKVYYESSSFLDLSKVSNGYTVHVLGKLEKRRGRNSLVVNNISILDTKPHTFLV